MAQNRTTKSKKATLEALEKSLGIVTTACRKVGIGRTVFYRWLKDDKKFKEAVDDIQEVTLDFVESQLHKQIKGGNTAATIFYMKTKGKKRGYIERKEVTGKDGEPLNENKYDLSRLSLEEKKAFLKLTSKIK